MAPAAPIVVVGAGIAGLCTALAAAPRRVLLLAAAPVPASDLAQGGIAAALGSGDSVAAHVADTLVAGARHNEIERVHEVLGAAAQAIAWLQASGVVFDQDAGRLHLGREGGHGPARIVHAGGDRTGAVVMAALRARVQAAAHIRWQASADVDALLLRDHGVAGVRMRDARRVASIVEADAVVLATGGIGALFARTTNPPGSAGSGLALALAAGARLRDLEFVQFHPTALACGESTLPLLTEALRGAGARLLDGAGRPLMAGLHALGDLAPRDIVARRVWQAGREGEVTLDATALADTWHDHFPGAFAACMARGIDPRTTPVPITAAAHFHMGGIATDAFGRSSLPGLYAVGEVACNGMHGANRLASNSLLEGIVCGRRLGRRLALAGTSRRGTGRHELRERGAMLAADQQSRLRALLWRVAGPQREARALAHALADLRSLAAVGWQARVAEAVLGAALQRRHSLGAHWRVDGPEAIPAGLDALAH